MLGKTQAEVKAKLTKAIENSRTLDVSRADEYTVATWLRAWFELYAKPHVRLSTADYYRRSIELHVAPAIGGIPLDRLTTRDLQMLYKDLQEHGRVDRADRLEGTFRRKPQVCRATRGATKGEVS